MATKLYSNGQVINPETTADAISNGDGTPLMGTVNPKNYVAGIGTTAYTPIPTGYDSTNLGFVIIIKEGNKVSAKLSADWQDYVSSTNIRFAIRLAGLETGKTYKITASISNVKATPFLRYGVTDTTYFDRSLGQTFEDNGDGTYTLQFLKAYEDDPFIDISGDQLSANTVKEIFDISEYVCVGESSYERLTPTLVRDLDDGAISEEYGEEKGFLTERPTDYLGMDIMAFNSCVCLGDSLTAGSINTTDDQGSFGPNAPADPSKSYPAKLAKLTGMSVTTYAQGGLSTEGWYDRFKDTDMSGFQMAIIQLGVNDQATGWTNDVKTAFTNIINKLRNENSNAGHDGNFIKIFVCNGINSMAYAGMYKNEIVLGIEALVEELGYEDVVLLDMKRYGNLQDVAYSCGHLSQYGYFRLAQDYANYISWYMSTNKEEFRKIQFIGTDYIYTKPY